MGATMIDHDQGGKNASAFVIVAAAAAKNHRPPRHRSYHAEDAGNGSGDRTDKDIPVPDMRQFMADHASQFFAY